MLPKTEEEWADRAVWLAAKRSNSSGYAPYRLALSEWADWCDAQGLDYGPGLRLIAFGWDRGRPCRPVPRDHGTYWVWKRLPPGRMDATWPSKLPAEVFDLARQHAAAPEGNEPNELVVRCPLVALRSAARAFLAWGCAPSTEA